MWESLPMSGQTDSTIGIGSDIRLNLTLLLTTQLPLTILTLKSTNTQEPNMEMEPWQIQSSCQRSADKRGLPLIDDQSGRSTMKNRTIGRTNRQWRSPMCSPPPVLVYLYTKNTEKVRRKKSNRIIFDPLVSLSMFSASDRNKERLKARWGRCKKMADWNQETSQQVWEFYEVKEQSQMPQQPEAIFQQNSAALPLADFLIVPQPRRRKCDTRRKRTRQPDSFFSELGTGLHSDSETEWSEDLGPSTSGNSAENSEIFAPPPPPLMNLIPTEVQLISDSLDPYRLQLDYGHRYWECSCFPRRFCVSIGDAVSNVMRISHGRNFAATAVVNVICVVECLPASEDEVQTCLSSEDGEELTLCRWDLQA